MLAHKAFVAQISNTSHEWQPELAGSLWHFPSITLQRTEEVTMTWVTVTPSLDVPAAVRIVIVPRWTCGLVGILYSKRPSHLQAESF